jgi:hypothetical protein
LAVAAGVNVLALQRMLGHTSAKMTLDTYADLFDDDLDAVAVTLHARYSPGSVGTGWARRRAANLKIGIYLRRLHHSFSAGEGSRTLTLFRAMAPKAIMSAIPSRPRNPAIVPLRPNSRRLRGTVGGCPLRVVGGPR